VQSEHSVAPTSPNARRRTSSVRRPGLRFVWRRSSRTEASTSSLPLQSYARTPGARPSHLALNRAALPPLPCSPSFPPSETLSLSADENQIAHEASDQLTTPGEESILESIASPAMMSAAHGCEQADAAEEDQSDDGELALWVTERELRNLRDAFVSSRSARVSAQL
jgi:hypothetical protein